MDVVRARRTPALRRALLLVLALLVVAAAAWSVPTLLRRAAALPTIDRASLVTGDVRRGTFVRSVRAPGLFVSDHIRIVAAETDGIVEAVPVRPGSVVSPSTVVAYLANADVEAAVADASAQLDAAKAELQSVEADATVSHLDSMAAVRSAVADVERSAALDKSYETLYAQGLISETQFHIAQTKALQDKDLLTIARRKVAAESAHGVAKISAARARVTQATALLAANRARVSRLVERSGVAGIVQTVSVTTGQRITAATQIAQIAARDDIKAVLQIAEADFHGVLPGMRAQVDAEGSPPTPGHVSRIEPTAQSGSVGVDIVLDHVPAGARPQQNINGTIELSRIPNALSVARPSNATDNSTVSVYRITDNGARAVRVAIRLGAGSLDRVQIVAGLSAGDTIIVSDSSSFHDAPVLRIQ